MIKNLEIKNFKSIKHLKLNCKRINLFIGKPNTGKSNILESLGLLSHVFYRNIRNFVRFESMSNLFYDENLDESMEVSFDDEKLEINLDGNKFRGVWHEKEKPFAFQYDYLGHGSVPDPQAFQEFSSFKFYRFDRMEEFPVKEAGFLLPPSGKNLLTVLMSHKGLKTMVSEIFKPFGFKLVFKPQESKIEVLKQYEDILISYPYSLVSDTLQRIVFYHTAIHSNKNSVLVFEEPESHAFPYYTKYLAEIIALDENNNQYFISTHNPYFLLSIIEKTPKDELGVFITYFEDYQTKVKPLSKKDIKGILEAEIDAFFNIERFLERG